MDSQERSAAILPGLMVIAMALAFRAVLELGYVTIVVPMFGYAGFRLAFDLATWLLSWLLFAGLVLLLPATWQRPSDVVLHLLFWTTAGPLLSYWGLSGRPATLPLMVTGCFLTTWAVSHWSFRLPAPPAMGMRLAVAVSVSATLATIALMVGTGLPFNLDLTAVYRYREHFSTISPIPGFSYLWVWTAKLFNPLLVALAVWRRKWFWCAVALIGQIMLFGFTSHKAVLFLPVLVVPVALFSQRPTLPQITYSVLVLGGLAAIWSAEISVWPASLAIRRLFYLPAQIGYAYFTYFSGHEHTALTTSPLIQPFAVYPYELAPPKVISQFMYGHSHTWANTGFLYAAYMQGGMLAMYGYAVVVGLVLALMNALATPHNWPVVLAICIGPLFALFMSADLPTTLLTHALAPALVFAWLIGGATVDRSVP